MHRPVVQQDQYRSWSESVRPSLWGRAPRFIPVNKFWTHTHIRCLGSGQCAERRRQGDEDGRYLEYLLIVICFRLLSDNTFLLWYANSSDLLQLVKFIRCYKYIFFLCKMCHRSVNRTGWHIRLCKTSRWHWCESCVLVWGLYTITQLSNQCQREVLINLMCHPVILVHDCHFYVE